MNTGETIALIKAFGGTGGGGSSLPAVTSSDNGKVLAVKDGAWAAGERNYVVTITYNGSGYSADKTYAEIVDAIHSGFNVIANFANEWYILTYVSESQSSGTICFSSIYGSFNAVPTISIGRTNSVTKKTEKNFLPLVSSSDNGSELIVKNGAWAKQEKKFIVTLTPTALDYSGTMDKTPAEITDAYNAGQEIVFDIPSLNAKINATQFLVVNDVIKAGGMVFYDVNSSPVIITVVTDSSASTYATQIFAMTPAS